MTDSLALYSTWLAGSGPGPVDIPAVEDTVVRSLAALARQRAVCRNPNRATDRVLTDVLLQAQGTAFARAHNLDRVHDLAGFRAAVPIRDYDGLRPYIDRIVSGERHVLTRDDPYALVATSGTSGRRKLIPTTRHWRDQYRGAALYAQWGLYFQRLGWTSATAGTVLDLSWERTATSSDSGSLPIYSITKRPASVGPDDWTPFWYDEPWFIHEGHGYSGGFYEKLRLVASQDIRLVVAVNPSRITALAEQLNDGYDQLLQDLMDGTLDGRPSEWTHPDPVTAGRLFTAKRFHGRLRLPDLWPNLSLLVCWNSASARYYRGWLEQVAPGVPLIPFSTTGSEGIVTIPVDTHASAGPVALDQGIFEFVPCDEADDGLPLATHTHTLMPWEVQTGQCYRLVMTQANGLYRYDVGDLYRVVGWVGLSPRLEFLGRAGTVSSFTGEKITEADVHAAVRAALQESSAFGELFSLVPVWKQPPGYELVIEQATGSDRSAAELAAGVERELCRVNSEYAEKRDTQRLAAVRVRPVPLGTFAGLADDRVSGGASASQIKHHWLQQDSTLLDHLDTIVPFRQEQP